MAFVHRTKRSQSNTNEGIGVLSTATSSSLGPGAYNPRPVGGNKSGYSYAPFASSAERAVNINNFTVTDMPTLTFAIHHSLLCLRGLFVVAWPR
jgi:hypothetical protein